MKRQTNILTLAALFLVAAGSASADEWRDGCRVVHKSDQTSSTNQDGPATVESHSGTDGASSSVTAGGGQVTGSTSLGTTSATSSLGAAGGNSTTSTSTSNNGESVTVQSQGKGSSAAATASGNGVVAGAGTGDCVIFED